MALPISLPIMQREVIDHSMGSSLDRCPRLTLYKYAYNRKPDEVDEHSANFGTHYHIYREFFDKLTADNPDAPLLAVHHMALTKAKLNFVEPSEGKKSYLDLGRLIKSCEAAYEKIINERNSGAYRVIHSEVSFDLPLPSGRRYGGRFDQIIEWNRRLWVRDFKTTSWLAANVQEKYALDHQMSGYVWAAQQLTNRDVQGVIVEILHNTQKEVAKIKPVLTSRTPQDIINFVEWAEDRWDEYQARLSSGIWPMRTMNCNMFFKKCDFFDCCTSGDYTAVETWLNTNSHESVWDFAAPREAEETE